MLVGIFEIQILTTLHVLAKVISLSFPSTFLPVGFFFHQGCSKGPCGYIGLDWISQEHFPILRPAD